MPPADLDRHRRLRQDASGPARGRRQSGALPRRRLAGRTGRAGRPGAGGRRGRRRPGCARGARRTCANHARRRPSAPPLAAGTGQLRASRRRLRRRGRDAVARLPAPTDPGHEPRGAGHGRRGRLARALARPPAHHRRPARGDDGRGVRGRYRRERESGRDPPPRPAGAIRGRAAIPGARAPPGPTSLSRPTTPARWSTCAGGSTGSRWPSSWPPRG